MSISIQLVRVEKLPSHSVSPGSLVQVQWERGSDKRNTGSFGEVSYEHGLGEWLDPTNATAKFSCTLIPKSEKTWKTKKFTLRVESFHPKLAEKKKKTVGKAVVNLSEYIAPSGEGHSTCVVPLQNRYNAGTITIEINATPKKLRKNSLTASTSSLDLAEEDSDDLLTDLGDVDGDLPDRVVPNTVAINSARLVTDNSQISSKDAKKQIASNKKKIKSLLQDISHVEHDLQKQQKSIEAKSTSKSPRQDDEISKILKEIRDLESAGIELDNSITSKNKQIKELENTSNNNKSSTESSILSDENDDSSKDNNEIESMMLQLEIEDLKQEIEYYNFISNEYEKVLEVLTPSKTNPLNPVAVFEQQLRFMKQSLQRYIDQFEEYQDYCAELEDNIEEYENRIAIAQENTKEIIVPPGYKDRVFFLRKKFRISWK